MDKKNPNKSDKKAHIVSDHESGQEGDFDEELYSGSARADYNQHTVSQLSHISSQTIQEKGQTATQQIIVKKGRTTISAMSQNERDEMQENEQIINQELIHQQMISSSKQGGVKTKFQNDAGSNIRVQDDSHDLESYDYDSEEELKEQYASGSVKDGRQKKQQRVKKIKNRSEVQDDGQHIDDAQFSIWNNSARVNTNSQENNEMAASLNQNNISNLVNNATHNSQDENQSQSYKGHSNNSPDDQSILTNGKKQPKQLKWILVSEGAEYANKQRNGTVSGILNNIIEQSANAENTVNHHVISTPQIKNHTATLFKKKLYIFGGYDGKKNHCNLRVFDTNRDCWQKSMKPGGIPPQGRNGHTATLVKNRLYIIGGWLGQGPFAADDMHILDLQQFKWLNYEHTGEPPGPCNMHTADSYEDKIYVFRGGDGRDYLNDLHELNTTTLHWRSVQDISGMRPPPRANHSSSIIQDNLYIFGGWDGSKRLNDLFVFNLKQFIWSQVDVVGESPAPRAGMELCNVNDKLYLFGGSGPHAFCFNDLYTFDPVSQSWEHCNNFRDLENNPNPKARAGHSMTLVDCKLYIIGGSYGQDYLKDVYILDTDPCPDFTEVDMVKKNDGTPQDRLFLGLHQMLNKQEFSDITFMVDDKPFYGHKIIISQLSEKFKAMFAEDSSGNGITSQSGFIESKSNVIKINNMSYPIFQQIMSYLYSGQFELGPFIEKEIKKAIEKDSETQSMNSQASHLNMAVDYLIDFLRVADEYLLEDVKNHCQNELIKLIDENTYQTISEMGELYNADRIVEYCHWFQRRKYAQYNLLDNMSQSAQSQDMANSVGMSTKPQKSQF